MPFFVRHCWQWSPTVGAHALHHLTASLHRDLVVPAPV
jgi:hypothetical protein